jgi:hypothetical protein
MASVLIPVLTSAVFRQIRMRHDGNMTTLYDVILQKLVSQCKYSLKLKGLPLKFNRPVALKFSSHEIRQRLDGTFNF